MGIQPKDLHGVIAASVLPFRSDYSIDEAGLEKNIQFMVGRRRLKGVLVNGLAGEVGALSREERFRVTEIAKGVTRDRCLLVSAVVGQSTREAIELAMDAEAAGADAILVGAPASFARGGSGLEEVVVRFFQAVSQAVSIPVLVFQHSLTSGTAYPIDILAKVCQLPRIWGIKSTVWEQERYEREWVALKGLEQPALVLNGNDNIMLSTFGFGADGAILGIANMLPDFIIDLFELTQVGQFDAAREAYLQMLPVLHAIYRVPSFNYYPRMKEAMVMLGMLEEATVRPPALPVTEEERVYIRRALKQAKLL